MVDTLKQKSIYRNDRRECQVTTTQNMKWKKKEREKKPNALKRSSTYDLPVVN